jgi:hypothetical protein
MELNAQLLVPVGLHSGKQPSMLIGWEAGQVPEPIGTTMTLQGPFNSDTSVVLPVASPYTD